MNLTEAAAEHLQREKQKAIEANVTIKAPIRIMEDFKSGAMYMAEKASVGFCQECPLSQNCYSKCESYNRFIKNLEL